MPRPQTPLARRTVRRFLDAIPAGAGGDANADVDELRQQLMRTSRALETSREEVDWLRRQSGYTRASVRNPFPDTVLPDDVKRVIAAVRRESLTYLSRRNLAALASVVAEADGTPRPGLIIEAGTALEGSAIVLAAAKTLERPMKVYDAFGMILEPPDADGHDVHKR